MNNAPSRNRGWITAEEQERLGRAVVGIAGLGAVGGRLATRLAALGVGGLRLADPDSFDYTNLNRQEGAGHSTIGHPKVDVISARVQDINPGIEISLFRDGITPKNCDEFVHGCDLIVEATDYTIPSVGLRIARSAAGFQVPTVMGVEVGFGAYTVWFDGVASHYEDFLGVPTWTPLDELDSGRVRVPLEVWLPHIPRYLANDVLEAVRDGEIEAPAIAPAVDLCSAMLSSLVLEILCGKPGQAAGTVMVIDVRERIAERIRFRGLHRLRSGLVMRWHNLAGKTSPHLNQGVHEPKAFPSGQVRRRTDSKR